MHHIRLLLIKELAEVGVRSNDSMAKRELLSHQRLAIASIDQYRVPSFFDFRDVIFSGFTAPDYGDAQSHIESVGTELLWNGRAE